MYNINIKKLYKKKVENMNKLLKTTGIFILGIGLMTGCTDKVAQKIENKNKFGIQNFLKSKFCSR